LSYRDDMGGTYFTLKRNFVKMRFSKNSAKKS